MSELKQCVGKVAHETRHAANQAIHARKGRPSNLTPYRCPYCHAFHIGHRPGATNERIRRGARPHWMK